jgi:serine/threonine-protein kinase
MTGGGRKGGPKTSLPGFAPAGTRLVELWGVGSVFEVGIVEDEGGRQLVCKRAAGARGPLGDAAIERERDVLRAAKGPHLVELVDFGSDDRGAFVLETRAPGAALRSLISDGATPMDGASWLALARASSDALASLHALGDARGHLELVHGDVSPDNVFFDAPGAVTFVDWASATFRDAPDPVFPDDRGTLPYVAPEVARREIAASAESDTYALAATLLAAAVGPRLTLAATDASRLLEVGTSGVRSEHIERRSDLPARAREAIRRALHFDRGARLTSSRELSRELGNQVG